MNMIEKVARAMTAHHYAGRFNKPVDDEHIQMNVDSNWMDFHAEAVVAVQAMRDPTDDMCLAAQRFMEGEIGASAALQGCAYMTMIDAALASK